MTLIWIHLFCEIYESLSGFGTTSSWHINFTVQAYGSKAMVMAIIEIYTAPFKMTHKSLYRKQRILARRNYNRNKRKRGKETLISSL